MTNIEKFDYTVDTSEWSTPWKQQARELQDLFKRVDALTLSGGAPTFVSEHWTYPEGGSGLMVTMTEPRNDWVRIIYGKGGSPQAVASRNGRGEKEALEALDSFCVLLWEVLQEVAP